MLEDWDRTLAAVIDHTVLKPTATPADIAAACEDALHFGFAAVVVQPFYLAQARSLLGDGTVRAATVLSFPFGAQTTASKASEARRLVSDGAQEIDMVMNIAAFASNEDEIVHDDVKAVVEACGNGVIVKLIIETAYLDTEGIARASRIGMEAGAHVIKTSTGYATRGATVDDVRVIREATKGRVGIKAAGGIRLREFALELVGAGATRIGCSASLDVIRLR